MQARALRILQKLSPDRREVERVPLTLPGRYMLSDGSEHPGWTVNISPGGVSIFGLRKGFMGERVVAYFDQIGRIEGHVARRYDKYFAVKLGGAALKREKLAKKIAWLVEHHKFDTPDGRKHQRVMPHRWRARLRTPDGNEYFAHVLDAGATGAALDADVSPPIGSTVIVGGASAQVVRHFDGGIAVAFDNPLSSDVLMESLELEQARLFP
jgi:hypothetical protein